jgi:hypothetical protein
MSKHSIIYIGLDTHKVSTEVAHIEDHRGAKKIKVTLIINLKVTHYKYDLTTSHLNLKKSTIVIFKRHIFNK